jgi:hypothetical protein
MTIIARKKIGAPEMSGSAPVTVREISPLHHDMDLSLPTHAPDNVTRKSQQLKVRAAAGRHIDKALAKMPASDATKASRKAKLIDLPEGTPPKRSLA